MDVGDWVISLLFAQLGTASTLEIIWTVVGMLGLILTLGLAIQARIDLAVLTHADDYEPAGPRRVIARDNIRSTGERVALFVLFVAIGVLAMTARSPNGRPGTTSLVFDAVLITMEFVLAWGAIAATRARARVFTLLYARSERTEALRMEAEVSARLRDREKPSPPSPSPSP